MGWLYLVLGIASLAVGTLRAVAERAGVVTPTTQTSARALDLTTAAGMLVGAVLVVGGLFFITGAMP